MGVGLSTGGLILMVGGNGINSGYGLMILEYILGIEIITIYMRLTIDIASNPNIHLELQSHAHDASKKSIEIIYCQIYTIFPRGAIISIFVLITTIYLSRFSSVEKTLENIVIRSFFYTISGDASPLFF